MKKILIPVAMFSFVGAAYGAVKCVVSLDPSQKCDSYDTSLGDSPTFAASCAGVTVKGVSYCSETTVDNVGTSGEAADKISKAPGANCWCKMVSPFVSKWIYLEQAMSSGQCMNTCSIDCGAHLAAEPRARPNSTLYRTALFGIVAD